MGKIEKVSTKSFTWVDISNPTKKDLQFLKSKFKVSDSHIAAALPTWEAQRPHVIVTSNYLFITVLFPIYNSKTRSIEAAEIDVFITNDHLFTIHDKRIQILNEFFNKIKTKPSEAKIHFGDKPSFLFYEILGLLYNDIFPKLDHVNKNINIIEKNIFKGDDEKIIQEILVVKTNVLNFKRIMQAHRSMIKKILKIEVKYFGSINFVQLYYNDLLDQVKDIWTIIETYGDSIESLENTNNTIIDQKVNRIVQTLTIVTVLVFPLTILGGIFGMNAKYMPIIGTPYDFWILVALMVILTVAIYIFFKKKKWM